MFCTRKNARSSTLLFNMHWYRVYLCPWPLTISINSVNNQETSHLHRNNSKSLQINTAKRLSLNLEIPLTQGIDTRLIFPFRKPGDILKPGGLRLTCIFCTTCS